MAKDIELTGKYKETYHQIKMELLENTEKSEATENALQDIKNMLFRANSENQPISVIFPDGLEIFCSSVLESLPSISVSVKYKLKKSKRIKKFTILFASMLIITALSLWYFGLSSYWVNGMWALVNEENHTCTDIELLRGINQPWTIMVDMNNLDSNIGKVLYADESGGDDENDCKITVGKVGFHEIGSKRQYWIMFNCYADYNLNHTTYYFPRYTPMGNENYLINNMIFESKEYTPLSFYGNGGGERDYEKVFFYLMETDSHYILKDPIVTLNFWNLDGYRYIRTGWIK